MNRWLWSVNFREAVFRGTVVSLFALLSGCGEGSNPSEDNSPNIPVTQSESSAVPATEMISAEEMRKRLGATSDAQFERSGLKYVAANLAGSGATTLEPLHGQPLKQLDLTLTRITDLSPLQGMPLERLVLIQAPVVEIAPVSELPLVSLDLSETKIQDLSPLARQKLLQELYIEKGAVQEISPLKDLPLTKLWLSHCPVKDLSPLAGKHFQELNLCNIAASDFSPLSTIQTETLWLRETTLMDLRVLKDMKLKSLDIQGTSVKDLSPLTEMTSLERLNISKSEVVDLTPLQNLKLTRLIFSPEKIEKGLDVVRGMKSLRQLDTSFEGTAPAATPSEFWEQFDRVNSKAETPK